MAKNILKPATIQNVKPTDKDQQLSDGGGLYLLIKSNGSKWWRLDYCSPIRLSGAKKIVRYLFLLKTQ
jgi:hypothetical protein